MLTGSSSTWVMSDGDVVCVCVFSSGVLGHSGTTHAVTIR